MFVIPYKFHTFLIEGRSYFDIGYGLDSPSRLKRCLKRSFIRINLREIKGHPCTRLSFRRDFHFSRFYLATRPFLPLASLLPFFRRIKRFIAFPELLLYVCTNDWACLVYSREANPRRKSLFIKEQLADQVVGFVTIKSVKKTRIQVVWLASKVPHLDTILFRP
jgi:hypothetical protein